ncbi:hypothetical protein ACQ4PT_014716 [Festuca glaucescens]
MEDMTRLPDITRMSLAITPQGHSFGASVFHVLRMSTSVRARWLTLVGATSRPEVQPVCPSGCICDHPSNWKTEELALNLLEEVGIHELRGTEHEAALIKRLFYWATVLKKMTVTFHRSVIESEAKEFFQMLQSFSRPEICMKGATLAGAADLFLWRNKKISGGVLAGATSIWLLFEVLEYHLLTLFCHCLILTLGTLFLWSNASAFINK